MAESERWWAKGFMFENCNCQLLCPGHLSFSQRCTHERYIGFWAFHVDGGRLETRYVPIHLRHEGRRKALRADGLCGSSVEAVKGADRERKAVLENAFLGDYWEPRVLLPIVSDWLAIRMNHPGIMPLKRTPKEQQPLVRGPVAGVHDRCIYRMGDAGGP